MPNHITNVVTYQGSNDDIAKLKKFVKGDETPFCFRKVLPMPPDLESAQSGTYGSLLEPPKFFDVSAERIYSTIEKASDENFEQIIQGMRNRRKHGHTSWYEWSSENWGTKWDAYDVSETDDGGVRFDTAWATPVPIFEALSRAFPPVKITVRHADEDIGSNCGVSTYINGVRSLVSPEGDAAIEFACGVKGWDLDEYRSEMDEA